MAAKSIIHFLVDCSNTMGETLLGNNSFESPSCSKLALAKSAMMTYCCQRTLDSKTVEFAVTSYGDQITDNHMANANQEGYDGINNFVKMDKVKQDSLQRIMRLEVSPKGVVANTISALMAATDSLMKAKQNYKYNRSLILVTDGEKEIAADEEDIEDLQTLVTSMNKGNPEKKVNPIPLYIILVGKVTDCSSTCKKENSKMLKSLAEGTSGGYIEADTLGSFMWLLSEGTGLGILPRREKVTLIISPDCVIPCLTWAKVMEKKMPSISKKLIRHEGYGCTEPSSASSSLPHPSYREPGDTDAEFTLENVKRDTNYIRPGNSGPVPESSEKITDGFKYGQYYVPVSDADKEAMKFRGDIGVRLIGFMRATDLPRHHFMGSTTVLQGDDKLLESICAIAALAKALRNMDCVGIARKVLKEGQDPCHVALMPPSEDDGTLLMQHIPCSDDFRRYPFPRLPSLVPRSRDQEELRHKQIDAMSRLVEGMNAAPEHITDLAISPVNPSYYRVIAAITQDFGVLNKGTILPSAGDVFSVPLRNKRKAIDAAIDLKKYFPLKKQIVEAKGAGKDQRVLYADRMAGITISPEVMRRATASVAKIKDESGVGVTASDKSCDPSVLKVASAADSVSAPTESGALAVIETLGNQSEESVLHAMEGIFKDAKKALISNNEMHAFELLQRTHKALVTTETCKVTLKESYNRLMKQEITEPFAPSVQRFFRFFDKISEFNIDIIMA